MTAQVISIGEARDHRARERQHAEHQRMRALMADIMQQPDLDALRARFTPHVANPHAAAILSMIDWVELMRTHFERLVTGGPQGGAS